MWHAEQRALLLSTYRGEKRKRESQQAKASEEQEAEASTEKKTSKANKVKDIPLIGFGTFLPDDMSDEQSIRMESRIEQLCAQDLPIVLDVANNYVTKDIVSKALKKFDQRKHICICAKGTPDDVQVTGATKMFAPLLGPLLGPLDIYLWHNAAYDSNGGRCDVVLPINERVETLLKGWRKLVELKRNGKIVRIGLSNIYNPLLRQFIEACSSSKLDTPDVVQLEVHILCPETQFVNYLQAENIHVMAYSPLGYQNKPMLEATLESWDLQVGTELDPVQAMLGWNVRRGITVIPQTLNPVHLTQNLNVKTHVEQNPAVYDALIDFISQRQQDNIRLLTSSEMGYNLSVK